MRIQLIVCFISVRRNKVLQGDFVDSFVGGIKQWEVTIYTVFIDEGISSDVISQWQELEEARKDGPVTESYEICKMTMADEDQIVKLLSKEMGCMPLFVEYDEVGNVKDFENTGYSFVAKKIMRLQALSWNRK